MEIQQGEIVRRLETLERKQESFVPYPTIKAEMDGISDEIAELEKRMNAIELKIATSEIERKAFVSRIGSMEDTIKWVVRLIIGTVILTLMGAALKGGLDGF